MLAKRTRPNVYDIYAGNAKTETDSTVIPPEFPLSYFFENFNKMAKEAFCITPTSGSNFKLCRAMWYVTPGYKVSAKRRTTVVAFRKALPAGFVLLYSTLLERLPLTLYPSLQVLRH